MRLKILIAIAQYYPSISENLYKGSTLELEKNNLGLGVNFWKKKVHGVERLKRNQPLKNQYHIQRQVWILVLTNEYLKLVKNMISG